MCNEGGETRSECIVGSLLTCRRGTDAIGVVVAGQLPQEKHNAPLHPFGASAAQVGHGARHYRRRPADTSGLLNQLLEGHSPPAWKIRT
jgi:hypothetical protein